MVYTAAETYFKERAEVMRRLEVLNNTLAQNTKYIVPADSNLVTVLGLDSQTRVVPIKTESAMGGATTPPAYPPAK
jgi:hypothetical protein